ncbi:MAG: hypothetical protein J6P94_06130 [Oscillospiraceae bacterium]|nr:hypothetical protein [Oscillospiraceae bacterium]
MSTVIFVKRNDAYRWAMMWAVADENRIVVDSSVIATTMNPSFADDVRPVAAACAANILINAARTGRDVAVVENVPAIERRLRFVAKKEGMEIKENGPSPSPLPGEGSE